ncbi:malto-oligosyltrehalose trehalohydrolase [Allostreptomyces psammosilenae]|uniref:Malto-oligosyltrehalose trehalohydrolase n=1 Tax=Allostreptomyces psammosilenae TaxID=1892865 RepID=A0A852ZLH7_9ACTN|nr:malto-oligosyltrehalose trehalohydrolase [Allostreptomyces psammosilenae]NYI03236.1 maltooligosyltrehalose trehalohydrolase [Allostreptomyces psammosilenae]
MTRRPRRFAVWAPDARRVEVVVDGEAVAMRRRPVAAPAPAGPAVGAGRAVGAVLGPGEPGDPGEGWWEAEVECGPLARYGFRLDGDETVLPDPRSPRQPDGPDGPSQLVDHDAFGWTDTAWRGRPLPGAVVYELHVGTFSAAGTFDGAVERLDHLVELGVDFVELMPVCPVPGDRNWGYDGVSLWAVHEPLGGPDGLKRFVDAAHRRGLGVLLDVVHNHLGPSGNHLPRFGPYFTDRYATPWGAAVNLDGPGSDAVREYLIGSALAWLRHYHLDGLRLDAVHALADGRARHFLEELSARVDALAVELGRPLALVAESDLNDPRLVTGREAGGFGLTAQWSDDFHHALHAALTGERQGYYADFADYLGTGGGPLASLAHTLTRVWLHDGRWSAFRGRTHGRPVETGRISGHRFLGYLQTHDQVGNRALGDRIGAALAPGLAAAGAALVLTSPFTPMLFMGEEWGAGTPWQFFTAHTDPELAEAVRRGRRREFGAHGWDAGEIPDPQDEATFLRSKLDWSEPGREPHAALLAWYRALIRLRRRVPALADGDLTGVRVAFDESERWLVVHRGPGARVAVNLAEEPRTVPLGGRAGWRVAAAWPGEEAVGLDASGASCRLPPHATAVLTAGGPSMGSA